MKIAIPALSVKQVVPVLCVVLIMASLVRPKAIRAQRAAAPQVAQVGPGAPLPVYVVNDPAASLPDGFVPGTSWKFTTWTTPSSLTFSATVEKIAGGWAFLTLQTEPAPKPRWYYVPEMPGSWEPL
jgi:hypothetical protein